jgi:hypothetical protein
VYGVLLNHEGKTEDNLFFGFQSVRRVNMNRLSLGLTCLSAKKLTDCSVLFFFFFIPISMLQEGYEVCGGVIFYE